MAGFRNLTEYVDAVEAGQGEILPFRRLVPSSMTGANQIWRDLSGGSGPASPPNYYASSPMAAATLDSREGLVYVQDQGVGRTQYIRRMVILSGNPGSPTISQLQNCTYQLCDYLLYYPFIDLSSTETQTFTNNVTLPRYVTGEGVKMLLVMQSVNAPTGALDFTINYTNQAGVAKTTVARANLGTYNQGEIVGALSGNQGAFNPNITSYNCFLALAAGDTGIRSIESVKCDIDWGGIACLVLVKPIVTTYVAQESRVNSNVAYGAASELEFIRMRAGLAKVEGSPYLMLIARSGVGVQPSSAFVVGTIETVWN